MNFAEMMDFSRESRFQEQLLKRIKGECFSELSDEDLSFVNAAGAPMQASDARKDPLACEEPGGTGGNL